MGLRELRVYWAKRTVGSFSAKINVPAQDSEALLQKVNIEFGVRAQWLKNS